MSLPTPDVVIVIVNFNSGPLLARCLTALAAQTFRKFEVVVLDNASTDDSTSVATAIAAFPARLIHAPTNLGFAAGANRALREAGPTPWVALLNPDAFPEPEWLQELTEAAARYPDCASFASCQIMANRQDLLDGTGDAYHTSGLAWRAGHGRPVPVDPEMECEVFSACAAAALYRRDVFDALGGLDEDFFCYMEDVDLGFRLRLAGWRCMYVPTAVVHHVGSATSGRRSHFTIYHGHRNLVWVYLKNMPGVLLWLYLPLHLLLNLIECCAFVARGQGRTILTAKLDAVRGLPRMWRKRKQVQAMRKCTVADILRAMQHGWPRRM